MTTRVWVLIVAAAAALPLRAAAEGAAGLSVSWADDSRALSVAFRNVRCEYPRDMLDSAFPPPGEPASFSVEADWPVVVVHARWSTPTRGWPTDYRPQAVDLLLARVCDAEMYQQFFPRTIVSSSFTAMPEFLRGLKGALPRNLAEAMRGKRVGYEALCRAGFGASDYTIRTQILCGASADGKTVFFQDRPERISDHLEDRQFFFAAHDAGDAIRFEARAICFCAPRYLFRDEMVRRITADSRYLVEQLSTSLSQAPTAQQIEGFLEKLQQRRLAAAH